MHHALPALLSLALISAACRSGPNDARDASAAAAPPSAAGVTDSLQVELLVPGQVRRGETVRFTLRVQNRAARSLDLYLRGRESTFDVEVTRERQPVWQRLQGEIIPAIVHVRTLRPAEQFELVAAWDQRAKGAQVAPGDYSVRGLLLAEGAPLATIPRVLRILDR